MNVDGQAKVTNQGCSLENTRPMGRPRSPDLQHPRGLHDGRLPLPLGELGGLGPVGIHPGKAFPIFIKNSDLPVLVLAPLVFPQLGALPCFFCFWHSD
jgi:hypothetical protein